MNELIGLTPEDEAALARLLRDYESGRLFARAYQSQAELPRVFEVVRVVNASGETIPPHAVMRPLTPTEVNGESVINVGKPNVVFHRAYLVNLGEEINANPGSEGWATWLWDVDWVLCDTDDGAPTQDEEWGPKDGEWKLFKDRPGFLATGQFDADTGRMKAVQARIDEVFALALEDIPAGGSGTVGVCGSTPGAELLTGQVILDAYNPTHDLLTGENLKISWLHGFPYLEPWETEARFFLGKANEEIPQNGTGSVSRYLGGLEDDTLIDDTVINKWPAIPSGSWVIYAPIGSGLYVVAPSGGGGGTSGVPIYNDTGLPILPYEVLDVVDTVDIDGTTHLVVHYPSQTFKTLWIVNQGAIIPAGETGGGSWRIEDTGPAAIAVDIENDISPGNELGLAPEDAATMFGWLQLHRPGFTALGAARQINGVWYVDVRQRPVTTVFGKSVVFGDGKQTADGRLTVEFDIFHRAADKSMRPTGWNRLEVLLPFLNKDDQLRHDTWGRADFYSGWWEGDFACDPDNKDTAEAAGGGMAGLFFLFDGGDPASFVAGLGAGSLGTGTGVF